MAQRLMTAIKTIQKRIAICILAIIFATGWIVAVYAEDAAQSTPATVATSATDNQYEKSQHEDEAAGTEYLPALYHVHVKITDALLVFFTFWLAVFTCFLWRSTNKLWSATKDLVSGADKTAQRQLRAYVTIDIARFEPPQHAGSPWYIHVVIKNFGQTPAGSLIAKTEYKVAPQEAGHPVYPFSINAQTHPKTFVAPGHQQTIRIHCPELGNGGYDNWNAFGQTNHKAYLWGQIDYLDCFDEPHFVKFQMICHFGQVTGFAQCPVGNDLN